MTTIKGGKRSERTDMLRSLFEDPGEYITFEEASLKMGVSVDKVRHIVDRMRRQGEIRIERIIVPTEKINPTLAKLIEARKERMKAKARAKKEAETV